MPRIETWSCASCGKQKGDANHWWIAGKPNGYHHFMILAFDDQDHRDIGLESYCGEACVLKAASEYLGKQKGA